MQTETEIKDPILKATHAKRMTNADFVRDFMIYGSPMQQVWLIEAVCKYAEQCVENKDEMIALMQYGLISGESWVAAAEEWQKRWKENYS